MRARMSGWKRPAPTYNAWTGMMVEEFEREEMLATEAEREARSILADAEPGDRGIFRSVRFLNAESGRMWAMEFLDERLALAESLRSFVEGN